jgi:hypothetical protein
VDYSQQSKVNFLYFTATTNSTMDYLVKVIEDGVVDSSPSRSQIPLTVNSPSPLRGTSRHAVRIISLATKSRSYRKL